MSAHSRLRNERGFTLIEVMVTILILVVGIGGAVAMIDGANARTLMTKERDAANALTREVIEGARSVPYRQLNPTSAVAQLKSVPGLEDSTPLTTAWTVTRRRQTYTIALGVCSVDDDQDGYGDTSAGNYCGGGGGDTADRNPDDYKRVKVDVSWKRGGTTRKVTHAGIVNNEASSAGPSVEFTDQDPPGDEIKIPVSSVEFEVQAEDGAVAIRFAVDGVLEGTANSTTASFDWKIDSGGRHIPDGTYLVSVTAFDAEGTPGPTRSRTIRLNRDLPAPPQDVFGGWNPRLGFGSAKDIVEIQWARNTEPDVIGYRVYRVGLTGPVLVPGCDFSNDPTSDPGRTECQDLAAPGGVPTAYYVVALDEDPTTGSPRESLPSAAVTAVPTDTRPNQPATLTATADDGSVVLTWDPAPAATPPYAGSNVIFYRVYRDGTALGDRIGRTGQDNLTSFRDSDAAAGGHNYWVSAVDENFSESLPLGPVALP